MMYYTQANLNRLIKERAALLNSSRRNWGGLRGADVGRARRLTRNIQDIDAMVNGFGHGQEPWRGTIIGDKWVYV